MIRIQFDDVGADDGQMLVYGLFINGDELIGFGDEGLADVMARIDDEECRMQIKAIYHDVNHSGLGDFSISFDVVEGYDMWQLSNLKVVLDGRTFELGGFREFADHNGMLGLRYSYRTRRLWGEGDLRDRIDAD